ncbi:MAG: class I adenylate-forming enzyme family protein [Burkholderiaceae bacterium]
MNLGHLLVRSARLAPQRPAVLLGTQLLCDYAGLAARAGALATSLRTKLALSPGDRAALLLRNCPQYLDVLWGAWFAGLTVVPINARLHPREVEYILADSGARCLFTDAAHGDGLPAAAGAQSEAPRIIDVDGGDYARLFDAAPSLPLPRSPQDVAWLFYTSGTTGQPKGVMQTHRNLMSMSLCYFADVDPVAADDASLYAAPMSHGAGLYVLPHVLAGARHVVPESGGFDGDEILTLARQLRQMSMFAAPTMVKRLVDHAAAVGSDGDGIKTVVYGGGPMYEADIRQALQQMGPRFVQIYGQGECPMAITALSRSCLADSAHPRHGERLGSVGVAQSNIELRIADDADAPLPDGEVGEILVRGDTVMAGYWRNPEASAQTLRSGWLHTGDVGALDADGFLYLKDRSKDLIISGGSNIYPREVEEVLMRHPAVLEAAVIGRPHDEWGEEVLAFVVVRPGARLQTDELDQLCLQNIARFKRPRHYRLLDELPKNNYGKVLKTALRQLDAAAAISTADRGG